MNFDKALINLVYGVFTVLYHTITVAVLLVLAVNIFTRDGKVGRSSSVTPHYSEGFRIAVELGLSIPDSIVSYEGYGSRRYREESDVSDNDRFFSNVPEGSEKTLIENKIVFGDKRERKKLEHLKYNSSERIRSEGLLLVKSTKQWLNILMQTSFFMSLFIFIYILYLMKNIFYYLKTSFSFNINMIKKVRWLGLLFIAAEFIKLVSNYILKKNCGSIGLVSYQDGNIMERPFNLSIEPILDFDFKMFMIGLAILVLSSLLRIGNRIEGENNLTI